MVQTVRPTRPRLGILPPHILTAISRNGTPKQRANALRTLTSDHTLRAWRSAAQVKAPVSRKRRCRVTAPEVYPRAIHDAANTESLSVRLVRAEGTRPTGDIAVEEAYIGLGATDHLFWEAYDRDSIDDAGMMMEATVHFGLGYTDAFWNGQRMVFGDGDGELFNRFTVAIEVIGHELTHGVIEHEGGLDYFGQPGALNESLCDVFGSLVKQRAHNQQAREADWLIGAGVFGDRVDGAALRSMKAPGTAYDDPVIGTDPQPGHMSGYAAMFADNGGVHVNSGIPNRAFYLLATALGGHAWEKAGRIWYESLRSPERSSSITFGPFAQLTLEVADRLYGPSSTERHAVLDAWCEVGILSGAGAPRTRP